MKEEESPCEKVRRTCRMVLTPSDNKPPPHVSIHQDNLLQLAHKIHSQQEKQQQSLIHANTNTTTSTTTLPVVAWDEEAWHYTSSSPAAMSKFTLLQRQERVALYILALDAINFCFWPSEQGLEYEHVAVALKKVAAADEEQENVEYALSPPALAELTPQRLLQLLQPHLSVNAHVEHKHKVEIPNLEERCRLLVELGTGLMAHFHSSALQLIATAKRSAPTLVDLVIRHFAGFRDEAIDEHGRQVFFYKRAQIVVADLWGALGQKPHHNNHLETSSTIAQSLYHGDCDFASSMDQVTTFADYRVPQLLRHEGVLAYSSTLAQKVDQKEVLLAGCREELEIRASTVVAVDSLVEAISQLKSQQEEKSGKENEKRMNAVQMDWYLWQWGESLVREEAAAASASCASSAVKLADTASDSDEKDRDGGASGTDGPRRMLPHHRVRTIFY